MSMLPDRKRNTPVRLKEGVYDRVPGQDMAADPRDATMVCALVGPPQVYYWGLWRDPQRPPADVTVASSLLEARFIWQDIEAALHDLHTLLKDDAGGRVTSAILDAHHPAWTPLTDA